MTDSDLERICEAIRLAESCNPKKESIPRAGAVIAVGDKVIGRGRRSDGRDGDDRYAEWAALQSVAEAHRPELPNATLYTTLEPCTRTVLTNGQECCTDLILRHGIKRVVIGILDPNQELTGKGLGQLQSYGVEVSLFPQDLAQQVRALNAEFIRAQQGLGAIILSPAQGETLKIYETGARYTIRFKCLNPPSSNTHLLTYIAGQWWPQSEPFRQVKGDEWAVDAFFGATGYHTLHIVTAGDLGQVLVEYYKKVCRQNRERRSRLKDRLDAEGMELLGGDYPGIHMIGLPKGLRSEASVSVYIAKKTLPNGAGQPGVLAGVGAAR